MHFLKGLTNSLSHEMMRNITKVGLFIKKVWPKRYHLRESHRYYINMKKKEKDKTFFIYV